MCVVAAYSIFEQWELSSDLENWLTQLFDKEDINWKQMRDSKWCMFTELRDKLLLALTDTTSWKNLLEDCLNKNYLNKEEVEEIEKIENFIHKTIIATQIQ
jgi:hypothetical protein